MTERIRNAEAARIMKRIDAGPHHSGNRSARMVTLTPTTIEVPNR